MFIEQIIEFEYIFLYILTLKILKGFDLWWDVVSKF
jgi:hypothetical protein